MISQISFILKDFQNLKKKEKHLAPIRHFAVTSSSGSIKFRFFSSTPLDKNALIAYN